jgi:competence protein ComEA
MLKTLAMAGLLLLCTSSFSAVEINTATEAELDSVKGLGPASTERILNARIHGPFTTWADFMARVKGIKQASASKLSASGLTVNGASLNGTSGK